MSRLRVGGAEIEFERMGRAGPVIVFESGLGEDMRGWEEVARPLSAFARLVLYDRPGIGQSGPRLGTRVLLANTVVEQLAALLQAIDAGPIALACAEVARNGSRLLRTLYAARSNATATKGGTYHATSKTNSRRME